jgi:hypothetical protein
MRFNTSIFRKGLKMKEIKTEVFIKADIEQVWKIFMDFNNYSNWNPYIKKIEGKFKEGKRIKVCISQKMLKLRPKIVTFNEQREIKWHKKFLLPGLFDRERLFKFKSLDQNKTLFIHYETVKGIFSPFIWKKYSVKTKDKFIQMNKNLKKIAEAPPQTNEEQKAA